jgi:tRNA(Leu) C34 or U34 (ribose-2'-O)-methylase TrmL
LLAANNDRCICIPMHGTRSLNLATAVGIVLFEAVRQQARLTRKHRNPPGTAGV